MNLGFDKFQISSMNSSLLDELSASMIGVGK